MFRTKNFLVISIISICLVFISIFSLADTPEEPDELRMDSSRNLTAWAWKNYNEENYEKAIEWANRCVYFWQARALTQSEGLTYYPGPKNDIDGVYARYWALNDVGTCWLIIGESYRHRGYNSEAEEAYKMLIDENKSRGLFFFAQCAPDPDSEYQDLWKPANAAYARLIGYETEIVDNVGLIKAAWSSLNIDTEKARKLAELCIDMFSDYLLPGDDEATQWARNDVATAYFIIGEAWRMDNSPDDANDAFSEIIDNPSLQGAQCLDLGPDGIYNTADDSYWDVVEAARDRLALAPGGVPTKPELYPIPLK